MARFMRSGNGEPAFCPHHLMASPVRHRIRFVFGKMLFFLTYAKNALTGKS
jgi:hypothetical protein